MAHDSREIRSDNDFVAEFAAFSSQLTLGDLTADVVKAAKVNLLDTLACATAGASAVGVDSLARLIVRWGGAREATILCSDIRVPAHHAAWINGMMAHARDYDDTHDAAILHAGVSVIPAALAAAEMNETSSGADLLAGIIAGLELICRLGIATRIGIIESGFIYSALLGHFAATAAAARVLRFDPTQTINAIGIAYSQAAGTHQVTRDAALTKRIQPGFAAKTALISVAMTQAGIRGAQNVFEGVDGLFRTYLRGKYDPVALREGLGTHYEFMNLSYKPYPCCRFNHTAIDAALELREKLRGDLSSIGQIAARVNRQSYEACGTPPDVRKRPRTIVQAQFSIPHTVAAALLNGRIGLGDFSDEALGDERVLALAAKVEPMIDESIERDWSRSISPTWLQAETSRGLIEARVDYPRGHPSAPMTHADFKAKLDDCLAASRLDWPTDTAARLSDAVEHIETLTRGADLVRSLEHSGGVGHTLQPVAET